MEKSLAKRQKSGSQVIMSDMISKLPDSLLQHILSFLPMEKVVATSLLSKRWRSLWLSMPTLDFDDRRFHSLDFFIQFVDTVLILGDLKPLKMFLLKNWTFFVPPNKANIWINTTINCKVEHLELCFWNRFNIGLHSHIFNCSSFRVLNLHNVTGNTSSFVNMPALKAMHLVIVQFPDIECLSNLLSGCAFLEELALEHLHILNYDIYDYELEIGNYNLTLDIESLEHLVSANVPSFLITSKAFSNVTHLWTHLLLNMETWSPGHDIPTFDNLSHIKFSCDEVDWNWIVECLRNCPKLEILEIYQTSLYPRGKERLMKPLLDVPHCVSSHLKKFSLDTYKGSEYELEIVRFILENARILRTISICSYTSDANLKLQMLTRLSLCPRGSENCKLLFK